jgi:hypothetical protein
MNVLIAGFLKEKLLTSEYAERAAGLVRVVNVKLRSQDGMVSRRIPMGCEVTNPETCPPHSLLVPDEKLSSMLWFEDGGTTFVMESGRSTYFTSSLRLIIWLNLNKYEHNCSITSAVFTDVIKRLMTTYESIPEAHSIRVESLTQMPKDASIFSSYDFENKNMFLIYPYDYLGIDIKTTFGVNRNCFQPIIRKDVECRVNTV